MNMKRFSFVGACALAFGLMACSSDDGKSGNPAGPDDPAVSSGDKPTAQSSSSQGASDTPLSSVEFEKGVTYVSITEIMYNAPDGSDLEWVELKIQSGVGVSDMSWELGLRLDGAVSYTFPAEPLALDEYIVVTNNPDLFKATYPDFAGRLFGPWDVDPKTGAVAKLANEGDVIDVKVNGKGDMTCAFSSEPPWTSRADGKGSTLVYIGGNPAQAAAWGASSVKGGNPGGPDDYIKPSKVRLNEVQPFVLGGDKGWVELYNDGDQDVDVSGWIFKSKYLSDEWVISAGVVPAKGYLVLDPSVETTFGKVLYLNPKGGEYYLYETVGGEKTGSESSLMLAASNLSSGIVEVGDGSTSQGALLLPTPGAANSTLKSGPVFINEIYYHPQEGGTIPFEFLELVNKSEADVNLYITKNGKSKGWKIEGVNMEFSSGDIIPAGGLMLVVSDSLKGKDAELRATYGIPENVPIAFYSGKLSNRGEMVAVKQPFDFDVLDGALKDVQWYYDWSDATLYSDTWPDLGDADGWGKSLQRVSFESMGYEAKSWVAGDPTPGK